LPKLVTIQIEAVVTRVNHYERFFVAILANVHNGRGHIEISCRFKSGHRIPYPGQAILLDAKMILLSARRSLRT